MTKKQITIPKNYWLRLTITFFLGWLAIWFYRTMLSPVYGEIQQTIGPHTNAQMGLISSSYFLGATALQIPSGFLVDRFGQKKVLIPSFMLFAAGIALIIWAPSIAWIYLGGLLAGIGTGSYYGAAFSLTAQYVPRDKSSRVTAIINSGSAVGMIVGMNAASLLVKRMGWGWQVLPTIALVLVAGLTLWFAIGILPKDDTAGNFHSDAEQPETTTSSDDHSLKKLPVQEKRSDSLFSPRLLAVYFLYFTTCYAYYLIVTWLPNFLETERQLSGGLLGVLTSMIAVSAVPGALVFATVADRYADKIDQLIVILEVVSFILLTATVLVRSSTLIAALLLAYGFFGKLALDPVLIQYVTRSANLKNIASTLGIFNFFGMAASVVAPTVTGFIIDITGSSISGFYLGAGMLLIGSLVFYLINRTSSAEPSQNE